MLPIIISWWTLHSAKAELVQIIFRQPNSECWVDSSLVVLLDPGIKPWRFGRMEGLYILKITSYKYLCQLICLAWIVDSSYFCLFLNLINVVLFLYHCSPESFLEKATKSNPIFVLLALSPVFDTPIHSFCFQSLLCYCLCLPSHPLVILRVPFYPSWVVFSFCFSNCLSLGLLLIHCLSILGLLFFLVYLFFLNGIVFFLNKIFLNW